ncbi:MAG: T9SS type A sorting domain-containing protein [FCB group bacterium]|nr:T9SS type A sorting domain-containing protein [FCB group bacterium]
MTITEGTSASLTNQAIYDSLRYHWWPAITTCIWNVAASDGDVESWADDPYGIGNLTIDISSMGTDESTIIPDKFALYPNYPNPFNPATTFTYDVAEEGTIYLTIFDLRGNKIRTLVAENQMPGRYRIVWAGKNDFQEPVASGMYFIRMVSASFTDVKKILLMK